MTNESQVTTNVATSHPVVAGNEPILVVKNIFKKYGTKVANTDISFVIHRGERVGIIGANGAGKSTLVEQIIGTTKPTSGTIDYKFKYKTSPQEKMGMQFQTSSYPEGLSVKDIIDFSLDIYASDIKRADLQQLLRIFQVQEFYKARAKSLSGGQQQKLNVLLAVAHNPELVILDEISTGLDVLAREEIIGFVDRITRERNMSVILISHHMSEIEQLCSRVIILSKGKIVADYAIDYVKKQYGSLGDLMRKIIQDELSSEYKEERAKMDAAIAADGENSTSTAQSPSKVERAAKLMPARTQRQVTKQAKASMSITKPKAARRKSPGSK